MLSLVRDLLDFPSSHFDSTVIAILIVVAMFLWAAVKILGPHHKSRHD